MEEGRRERGYLFWQSQLEQDNLASNDRKYHRYIANEKIVGMRTSTNLKDDLSLFYSY